VIGFDGEKYIEKAILAKMQDGNKNSYKPPVKEEKTTGIVTKNLTDSKEIEAKLPEFNSEWLPYAVREYAEDVAKRMNNAPFELVATAGLLTLAGSINRRIGIRPKINDNWTVYPNMYGMLIAPPSTKKALF